MSEQTDKYEFVEFLENTLIPDLKESGMDATAEDFETAVSFIAPPYERLVFISQNTTVFAFKLNGKAVSLVVRNKTRELEYDLIKHEESFKGSGDDCGSCAIFPNSWCEFDVMTNAEVLRPFISLVEEGDVDGLFEALKEYYATIFN